MKVIAENCNVYSADNLITDLNNLLQKYADNQVFTLVDTGSEKYCLNHLNGVEKFSKSRLISIPDGDENKNYESALKIWNFLSTHGATRKAVLVNLGGGMICDLGGFCASTFKRGIDFINIPTTLLAQVDASLGGKTGMNLESLKNEIGVFSIANAVIIDGNFLKTLDHENLLSGYAEMLKHSLIGKADELPKLMQIDFNNPDYAKLQDLVCTSIQIKNRFVTEDPKETGIRKALNFGHTFGHAFETLSMRNFAEGKTKKYYLHGYAVAFGLVCELMMSEKKLGLKNSIDIQKYINKLYGKCDFAEIDSLIELMTHDKKNDGKGINFTLLPEIGHNETNQIGTRDEISKILESYLVAYW